LIKDIKNLEEVIQYQIYKGQPSNSKVKNPWKNIIIIVEGKNNIFINKEFIAWKEKFVN
jgi:hypothetical protein